MKRIFAIACAVLLLISLLTACGKTTASPNEKTVTVTDHNGNTVTVPANIERIAVCDVLPLPSVLCVFFNSAEKIVAMSPSSMQAAKNGLLSKLYPEILSADTGAIDGADVNVEELMKQNPQVVFYEASNTRLGETLTKAGFAAVAVSATKWDYNAVETLNQWITLLSQLFPKADNGRADAVRTYSEQTLSLVKERTASLTEAEKQSLFFLVQYSPDAIVTSGSRFFGQWWADSIGAVNASGSLSGEKSVKVTAEQVYIFNPDVVLLTNFNTAQPKDLYQNTVGNYRWDGISAVQNKRVYKMPLGLYRSFTPGADTPVTLLWLAKTVYPEQFADIDITDETIRYYQTVFGVALTHEQAASIFSN